MKIETYLNAFSIAYARYLYIPEFDRTKHGRRMRQYRAFRTRILRMNAEKDARIIQLHKAYFDAMNMPPPNPPRK